MHIHLLHGPVPGHVQAQVHHDGSVRLLSMELGACGGAWMARSGRGQWSVRCSTPMAAALLEAADAMCPPGMDCMQATQAAQSTDRLEQGAVRG